jgi:hypothetical protein
MVGPRWRRNRPLRQQLQRFYATPKSDLPKIPFLPSSVNRGSGGSAAYRGLRSNAPVIVFKYGDLWEWEVFDLSRLVELMCGFDGPWWVARGSALALRKGCRRKESSQVDRPVVQDKLSRLRRHVPRKVHW